MRAAFTLSPRVRTAATVAIAVALFAFSWLFRFNDPAGSFAGLTDDHFFYLVRGWQILYGDLPVRDFVDHGAPLYYYLAAAVQMVSRGTYSELVFSTTLIAAGAAATFWLAARASGSLLAGLAGAAFQVLLSPRFYNYPKILVYTAAIPLLWWFADRPGRWSRFWLAIVTAVGFLLRHDHGFFTAIGFAAMLLLMTHVPWRARVRHAAIYLALVVALLSPYLAFIEMNGGVGAYISQASAWAARDRDRAPVIWPGLFDNPDGVSVSADDSAVWRAVASVRDNDVAWLYYVELVLPFVAALVLLLARHAARPAWTFAPAKVLVVAVLGLVLNAGFLRSPLGARLADPSVPHAILIAWLLIAVPRLLWSRDAWRSALRAAAPVLRVVVVAMMLPLLLVLGATLTRNLYDRLDAANLVERPGNAIERSGLIASRLREDWQLAAWVDRPDRPELITLAMYLNTCTAPDDRVFIQGYLPQVLALARRGFAGGHADLRPGFFNTPEAQALTLERLSRQSVPVVLLDDGESLRNFRQSFPRLAEHFDRLYTVAGTHEFDGRFGITLLLRKDRPATKMFEPLMWPCP
jgi:hypothetical protein